MPRISCIHVGKQLYACVPLGYVELITPTTPGTSKGETKRKPKKEKHVSFKAQISEQANKINPTRQALTTQTYFE